MRAANVTWSRLTVATVAVFAFASCSSDSATDTTATHPDPTIVGGAPAPTADPKAPPQVGPIDPGMTMSGDSVVTSISIPGDTTTVFKP